MVKNIWKLHPMPTLTLVNDGYKVIPLNQKIEHKMDPPILNSVAISTRKGIEIIDLDKIIFMKSDDNYTLIYMVENRKVMVSNTLKKYEILLQDIFIRIHNSYLINPFFIKSYISKVNKILLKNNVEIPVSRSKKSEIREYLKSLKIL